MIFSRVGRIYSSGRVNENVSGKRLFEHSQSPVKMVMFILSLFIFHITEYYSKYINTGNPVKFKCAPQCGTYQEQYRT